MKESKREREGGGHRERDRNMREVICFERERKRNMREVICFEEMTEYSHQQTLD